MTMRNLFLIVLAFVSLFSYSQKMTFYPDKFETVNKAYVRKYMGSSQNTIYYVEFVRGDIMQIGSKDIFYVTTFDCDNLTFNRVKIKYENNINEFYNAFMGGNDEAVLFARITKKGPKKNAIAAIKLDNNLNVTSSKVLYESDKDIEGEKLIVSSGQKYFAVLTPGLKAIYDFNFLQIKEDKTAGNPIAKPCLTDEGVLYYLAVKNESLFLCCLSNAKENQSKELKVEEGTIDVFIKVNPGTGNIHYIESFGESESKVKSYLGNTQNKNYLKSIRHTIFDKDMNAGKQEDI